MASELDIDHEFTMSYIRIGHGQQLHDDRSIYFADRELSRLQDMNDRTNKGLESNLSEGFATSSVGNVDFKTQRLLAEQCQARISFCIHRMIIFLSRILANTLMRRLVRNGAFKIHFCKAS